MKFWLTDNDLFDFFDFPIKKQSFCADLYNVLVLAKIENDRRKDVIDETGRYKKGKYTNKINGFYPADRSNFFFNPCSFSVCGIKEKHCRKNRIIIAGRRHF